MHLRSLAKFFSGNITRSLRHRDFRLLWLGAFFSFTGSWIQNLAQGWVIFEITHSYSQLGLITFLGMAPISILGPFAGTLADTLDRRKLLIAAQGTFAVCALTVAFSIPRVSDGVLIYMLYTVALINGIVGAFEMPARQSVISKVVPPEDLPAAVPINAMTFNLARVIGPAIGGLVLANFGAYACYLINGFSYAFLILAALAIRADLRAEQREPQPIMDLLFEGMKFTFRDPRLKTLFIMETIVSAFGLVYLSQMAAFAKDVLKLGEHGLGFALTCIGIGAIMGLLFTAAMADSKRKGTIIGSAMFSMAVALILLSFVRGWPVFILFIVAGASTMMQFNTTNALFQTLSPPRLRGRVIAMHVWALAGMSPFGALLFGWLANVTRSDNPNSVTGGLPLIILLGGCAVMLGAIWGYSVRDRLRNLEPLPV